MWCPCHVGLCATPCTCVLCSPPHHTCCCCCAHWCCVCPTCSNHVLLLLCGELVGWHTPCLDGWLVHLVACFHLATHGHTTNPNVHVVCVVVWHTQLQPLSLNTHSLGVALGWTAPQHVATPHHPHHGWLFCVMGGVCCLCHCWCLFPCCCVLLLHKVLWWLLWWSNSWCGVWHVCVHWAQGGAQHVCANVGHPIHGLPGVCVPPCPSCACVWLCHVTHTC